MTRHNQKLVALKANLFLHRKLNVEMHIVTFPFEQNIANLQGTEKFRSARQRLAGENCHMKSETKQQSSYSKTPGDRGSCVSEIMASDPVHSSSSAHEMFNTLNYSDGARVPNSVELNKIRNSQGWMCKV